MEKSNVSQSFFALSVGALLIMLWAHLAGWSLVLNTLLACNVSNEYLRMIILGSDFVINMTLILPAAWIVCLINAQHIGGHAILVLIPVAIWLQVPCVILRAFDFSGDWGMSLGTLLTFLALPVSLFALKSWLKPSVPKNQSCQH